MNIKTTKKLIIAIAFIVAFMLLGTANKVEASTKWEERVSLEKAYGTDFTINASSYNHDYISNFLVHKIDKNGKVVEEKLKYKVQNAKRIYKDGNIVISIEQINHINTDFGLYGSKSLKINIYSDNNNEVSRYYRFEVQFWHKAGTSQAKRNIDVTVYGTTTITIDANDGKFSGNASRIYMDITGKVKITDIPTKSGYTFKGYTKTKYSDYEDYEKNGYYTENGKKLRVGLYKTGVEYEAKTYFPASCTLYAVWEKNKNNPTTPQPTTPTTPQPKTPTAPTTPTTQTTKTITLNANSGKFSGNVSPIDITNKEKVKITNVPTKSGYIFKGYTKNKYNDYQDYDKNGYYTENGKTLRVKLYQPNEEYDVKTYFPKTCTLYAVWEKDDKKPTETQQNSTLNLSGILGKLINIGTSTIPTVIETGINILTSDTVKTLSQSAFGVIGKVFGTITENAGNSLFKLFSSKKETNPVTPTDSTEEPTTPTEPTEESIKPTESGENNGEEKTGAKILYKELDAEMNGNKVNQYVIQLKEDLYVKIDDELGKIIINSKYPIFIIQADNDILVLMGMEEGDRGYDLGDETLYLDKEGKIYKKLDKEYVEIAKFEEELEGLEGLEKEGNYYIIKTEYLVGTITSEELEKLLKSETNEPTLDNETLDDSETSDDNEDNENESNNDNENTLNIGENLSNILSSDLISKGLDMAENLAGTATGLISSALDKIGSLTGASIITEPLKEVVDFTGNMISNGTARSVASTGLGLLQNIGKGLKSMFGAK